MKKMNLFQFTFLVLCFAKILENKEFHFNVLCIKCTVLGDNVNSAKGEKYKHTQSSPSPSPPPTSRLHISNSFLEFTQYV